MPREQSPTVVKSNTTDNGMKDSKDRSCRSSSGISKAEAVLLAKFLNAVSQHYRAEIS